MTASATLSSPSMQATSTSCMPRLLEVVQNTKPVLGAFVSAYAHAKAVCEDSYCYVHSLPDDGSVLLDMIMNRIYEHDYVSVIKRSALPCLGFGKDSVGYLAYRFSRGFYSVALLQMAGNVPCSYSLDVHGNDSSSYVGDFPLVLSYGLRLKIPFVLSWNVYPNIPVGYRNCLPAMSIAAVGLYVLCTLVLVESKVVVKFSFKHAKHWAENLLD